jgi:hypothetical protein
LSLQESLGSDVVVIEHRNDVNVGMRNVPSGRNEADLLWM